MYSALAPEWQFMGDNSFVCKCLVYLEVVLFASTVYTLAWIGIDRYAALMKPQRQDEYFIFQINTIQFTCFLKKWWNVKEFFLLVLNFTD